MLVRPIPRTGETIPAVGLGTWKTFDVSEARVEGLADVTREFLNLGGRLIDTSPMYGRSESILGSIRERLSSQAPELVESMFLATKVWTRGREDGRRQMEGSFRLLRTDVIDLMQIHNLVDWTVHLPLLRDWRAEGRVRYIGITHYQTSAFGELARILENGEFDFVQLPYSILMRQAEETLLPLCGELGVAVIANRPFEESSLLRMARERDLPPWAEEVGSRGWPDLFLRYLLSHQDVACVIPATSDRSHLEENMRAGEGLLLDDGRRADLVAIVESW